MSPVTKTNRRQMAGYLETEIFSELMSASWDKPAQKNIEELKAAIGTAIGSKRKRNEDRAVVARVFTAGKEYFSLAIVCDGVGGSEMGDTAAARAVAAFIGELANTRERMPVEALLVHLVRRTDDIVRAELNGRGTTTASIVLLAANGQLAAANVGDSRIFSWTPSRGIFEQISVDDTLENELRNMDKDPAVLAARGLEGALSQAIGEAGRSAESLSISTFTKSRFAAGVVLATDGAWKGSGVGFRNIVLNVPNAADAVRRVLAVAAWTGGEDNASIVAIDSLEMFARAALNPTKRADYCPRVSLWYGDSKLTLRDQPSSASWAASSAPAPMKDLQRYPERKGRRGHLKKENKNKDQLNLLSESRESAERPRMEISDS